MRRKGPGARVGCYYKNKQQEACGSKRNIICCSDDEHFSWPEWETASEKDRDDITENNWELFFLSNRDRCYQRVLLCKMEEYGKVGWCRIWTNEEKL